MIDENTAVSAELRNYFGPDVVIGIVEIGNDAVVADCREGSSSADTDFADQNRRQFQAAFGVACGRLEQRTLCGVLFRKRAALQRFWADNPSTRRGLVTWWPGVLVLWIWVAGNVPRNMNFGTFSWCSVGVVPVGAPELPMNNFIAQASKVSVVDFKDLRWQELEQEAMDIELLEEEVGSRFLRSRSERS